MMQLVKLGWKNLFRNKRRTILTGLVIGLTLACLIVQDSITLGMMHNIFRQATSSFLGQAQIHNKEFLEDFDIDKTIEKPRELLSYLQQEKDLHYSQRVVGLGMLSSPRNSTRVSLYGVDLQEEKHISKIQKALKKGSYKFQENSLFIGHKLATLLEVQLGDRIVITVARAKTEELRQEMAKIAGIFQFGDPTLDTSFAFMPLSSAQKLFNLDDRIHEIALQFKRGGLNTPLPQNLILEAQKTNNELLSWKELLPSIEAVLDMVSYATLITMIIVFILVVFIIINTLFMALFERLKEFGVLRAIGTKPSQTFSLILIEAASLAFISIIIGIVLAVSTNALLSINGISFTGIEMGGVTIIEPIYPQFSIDQVTLYPLSVFLFTLISAIYPAAYAAKITPIKALQKEG